MEVVVDNFAHIVAVEDGEFIRVSFIKFTSW